MDKGEHKKHYTFMVIPHDAAGRPITFRLPKAWARFLVLIAVVSVAVFSLSLLYSTFLSGQLIHYGITVDRESTNEKQVNNFLNEKNRLQSELQAVLDQNNELRRVLGLRINKTKVELSNKDTGKRPFGMDLKLNKISSLLDYSLNEVSDSKVSMTELKARVKEIQDRFSSTPSTWPLRGRIMSGFGWRSSPWRGFHAGIDIQASYGAPVRATAPGIVSYAGWRQGYGRTVEIDHGHGFKTLYGHNSRIYVRAGEKVNKGMVVSAVGLTGYTTGPHLHYEVQKNNIPLSPVAFLNLNILSAGRFF